MRRAVRIDFKIYHESGVKKVMSDGEMDETGAKAQGEEDRVLNTLVTEELKVSEDIRHDYELYNPDDLITEDEIHEALDVIKDDGQKFRHIHVELKKYLGEVEHGGKYPKYADEVSKAMKFVKKLKEKLREVRKNSLEAQVTNDGQTDHRLRSKQISVDEDVLNLKVETLNGSIDLELAGDIREVDSYITKMEEYTSLYLDLVGKIKLCYRDGEEDVNENLDVQKKRVETQISQISQDLKIAKVLRKKLTDVDSEKQNATCDLQRKQNLLKAQSLEKEILLRGDALALKLDREFHGLSDYQLLEIASDKTVDSEFNEILTKVTDLSSYVVSGDSVTSDMLTKTTAKRDRVAVLKKDFQKNLSKILVDRDITPDKLKNATSLDIELPKFSGYDCAIDFFTFKTEFKKLKEPMVQRKYWSDFLKKNHLTGSALALVEKEDDYDKIWSKLKESYGNPRLLLQNKMSDLDKLGGLWKIKGDSKLSNALAGLINTMKELGTLATEHGIEGQLYEGGGLERVLFLVGKDRHKRFRTKYASTLDKKAEFGQLLLFLEAELNLLERMNMDFKTAQLLGLEVKIDPTKSDRKAPPAHYGSNSAGPICHFCGGDKHTVVTTRMGKNIIPYHVCKKFCESSAAERFAQLVSKNLCTVCLLPGAEKGHKCFTMLFKFCCPHPSHQSSGRIHVLVCDEHKKDPGNLKSLEDYKKHFIDGSKFPIPDYGKKISCFADTVFVSAPLTEENIFDFVCEVEIVDSALFNLQTVFISCNVTVKMFFDNGCGDMIVKKAVVEVLLSMGRARLIRPGPIDLAGVGDHKSICYDGVYSICLPLHNGRNAILTGLCLPKVTSEFPEYGLRAAENDLRSRCFVEKGQDFVDRLPHLPDFVGGDTDILLGVKYAKYFPKLVFQCEDGFGIGESAFSSPGGSRGVLFGPHQEFSRIEREFRGMHASKMAFFHETLNHSRYLSMLSMSMPLVEGVKDELRMVDFDAPMCCTVLDDVIEPDVDLPSESVCVDAYAARRPPKCIRQFDEVEKAGTEVTYRCVDCRGCPNCKFGERFESISIQDEHEQALIERSVEIIPGVGAIAYLPFVVDPDSRIDTESILKIAMKVFFAQVRKLNMNPSDKSCVIESEAKLQQLGFVDYVDNLDPEVQEMILGALVRYFIPWIAVFNKNSATTPWRLVFNASMGSKNSCSLNSLLAKGVNGMNKLLEIFIRWRTRRHAFHTDVSKMYNCVKLRKEHWRYQLYLWNDGLDPNAPPRWKTVKSVIYGVRSSGNQAECALRRTAELSRSIYPEACSAIVDDTYVDDCFSGTDSLEDTLKITDEIQTTLSAGGFSLKGFSMSGERPPEHMSLDLESAMVSGTKWFSEGDFFMIPTKEVNLGKKISGKKSLSADGVVPDIIEMRECSRVVHEIFDLTGLVAPLTGGFKVDMSVLHQKCPTWDDPIPAEVRNTWLANFDVVKEIGNLKFRRAVIPPNAVSLDAETIETADAGEHLICVAIYIRYKLRDGGHSCQLIFARTKIIHDISTPRAELAAALLNASTGHVVLVSLKGMVKKRWKLTDSQVALHWVNCTKNALKMWVRNRVTEIVRLSDRTRWFYVASENMIADIGTRKGATIEDVGPDSPWINGYPWMRDEEENFPIKTVEEIILSSAERAASNKEKIFEDLIHQCLAIKVVPKETRDRYTFSNYLVDPNRFQFSKVLRVLALVFLFLKRINVRNRQFEFLRSLPDKPIVNHYQKGSYLVFAVARKVSRTKIAVVGIDHDFINAARNYYFTKATAEVKKFVNPTKYQDKTEMRDGILYYTGRILASQDIDGKASFSDACLDLSAASFCVPVTDSVSPIAYAIVMETHWFDPDVSHGGVESVLRVSQNTAYIIGGRELVKGIKRSCTECRILHKKGVRVAMGQIGENNLTIAPAFYQSQVDICGPFSAYSPANKRATLKVYFVVFCCTTTGAVDCRVMEDYTADAFILSFIRFSSRFGYPKTLMPDEGSQLVKGCQDMVLSFSDLKHRLFVEHGVEYITCPVGAHYVHGKVERKIQSIKRSFSKILNNNRLSILQWETLGQQVANSINNMPIGLKNKCEMLENLDLLTPNRLILGRNNSRSPTVPLEVKHDMRGIIESNKAIVDAWFKVWLTSYVPTLIDQPKWFTNDRGLRVGDVVLFLKSDREFDRQYQYGLVTMVVCGRDGLVRVAEIQYQNCNESVKRTTKRGVREVIVIHPVEEIGIYRELHELSL